MANDALDEIDRLLSKATASAHSDAQIAADIIRALLGKYWILDDEYRDVIAMWALHTWIFDQFGQTPYLMVSSDRPGSGKSDLLRFLTFVCKDAAQDLTPTAPAIYAAQNSGISTILVDQADTWLTSLPQSLESTVLGGYARGGLVTRGGGSKNTRTRVSFDPFFPKAFAGIRIEHKVSPAFIERSVLVVMNKSSAPPADWSADEDRVVAHELAKATATLWAKLPAYNAPVPAMPTWLVGRRAQIWRPLFALAEFSGGPWPKRIEKAAKRVESEYGRFMVDDRVAVLIDLKAIFDERFPGSDNPRDFISRRDLCQLHRDIDCFHFGRVFTSPHLLRKFMLREFGVEGSRPYSSVKSDTARGFARKDLLPVWKAHEADMP